MLFIMTTLLGLHKHLKCVYLKIFEIYYIRNPPKFLMDIDIAAIPYSLKLFQTIRYLKTHYNFHHDQSLNCKRIHNNEL